MVVIPCIRIACLVVGNNKLVTDLSRLSVCRGPVRHYCHPRAWLPCFCLFLSASAYQLHIFFNAGPLSLCMFPKRLERPVHLIKYLSFLFGCTEISIFLGVCHFAMEPTQVQAPLAGSRQNCLRPQSAQDWENQKAKIKNLYESNELKETMEVMEKQHSFKATYAMLPQSLDPA